VLTITLITANYFGALALNCVWLAAILWMAYRIVLAFDNNDELPTSARFACTALLAYWLTAAVALVLLQLGLFSRVGFSLVLLVLGISAQFVFRLPNQAFRLIADFQAGASLFRSLLQTKFRFAVAAGFTIICARLVRGLVRPPLGWDSLTYHLVKAAEWVQAGHLVYSAAPDAAGYYGYFPPVGDMYWAVAMLASHSDAFLAPAGLLVWCSVLLGGYAVIRQFAGDRTSAVLGALVIAFAPAVTNLLTSAYVDNSALAVFLLAIVATIHAIRTGAPFYIALGVGGLGLCCGIKSSFLSVFAAGSALLMFLAMFRPLHTRKSALLALCIAACSLYLPAHGYVHAYFDTGNPLYPLPLKVGKLLNLPGNAEFTAVAYASTAYNQPPQTRGELIPFIYWFFFSSDFVHQEQLQFTWAGFFLLLISVPAALYFLSKRKDSLSFGFILLCGILLTAPFLSDEMRHYRSVWYGTMGRLLSPAWAMVIVVLAVSEFRVAHWGLIGALPVLFAYCMPLGWAAPDLTATLHFAPAMACLLAALIINRFPLRTAMGPRLVVILNILAACAFLLVLPYTRSLLRYRYYAAVPGAYDMHQLEPRCCSAQTWRGLDDGASHHIAFCAGWAHNGHNWYRYPLFGTRLRNTVSYVPMSKDGKLYDYLFTNPADVGDYDAWLSRIQANHIEYVVCGWPTPYEDRWMAAHPDRFKLMVQNFYGDEPASKTYRVLTPTLASP
jgi:hypothetical protein